MWQVTIKERHCLGVGREYNTSSIQLRIHLNQLTSQLQHTSTSFEIRAFFFVSTQGSLAATHMC